MRKQNVFLRVSEPRCGWSSSSRHYCSCCGGETNNQSRIRTTVIDASYPATAATFRSETSAPLLAIGDRHEKDATAAFRQGDRASTQERQIPTPHRRADQQARKGPRSSLESRQPHGHACFPEVSSPKPKAFAIICFRCDIARYGMSHCSSRSQREKSRSAGRAGCKPSQFHAGAVNEGITLSIGCGPGRIGLRCICR